jgi:two-component system sensor histidine kinase TctE
MVVQRFIAAAILEEALRHACPQAKPRTPPWFERYDSDLRNRLLLLLVLPLCVLALVGVWMDYRSADDAASRHDQRLLRLLPALARWWRLHP